MKLLHFGLQRSGTNYLELLLRNKYKLQFLNSNNDRSSPLHKHCRLYKQKGVIPELKFRNDIIINNFESFESLFDVKPDYYIVISKDPYSWYLSYTRWSKKCGWPKVNHHYIEEYKLFYEKFIELSKQTEKFIFVRYIDLVKDTNTTLKQLEEAMSLKSKLNLRVILRKPKRVSQSSWFTAERRSYYLDEKYLKEFSIKELQTINALLGVEPITSLGYQLRSG